MAQKESESIQNVYSTRSQWRRLHKARGARAPPPDFYKWLGGSVSVGGIDVIEGCIVSWYTGGGTVLAVA